MLRKSVIAWAFYDWGNSAFATSVMVAFFPLFFNDYWSEAGGATTTTRLMLANGVASALLALAAPLLGAIADRGERRKPMLVLFAWAGAAATAALYFTPQGSWLAAAAIYGAAVVGFSGANVFYDSMLTDVARRDELDRVSAFGFSLGYLGGGILLTVNAAMTVWPDWFGLADRNHAVQAVFVTVAVWWAAFTVPLLLATEERRSGARPAVGKAIREGLAQLAGTFRRIRSLRPVWLFLIAYWLYIDGVNTVMKAAVDFGYKLDFGERELVLAVLIVQFVSFPAALAFGWLGERIGPRRGILLAIGVYVAVIVWAMFMDRPWEFYTLACAIGLVQGGVASLSRSFYARLIPEESAGEFFGFYNMIGKFATVLGPFLMAGAASATGSTRISVLALLPLFLVGGGLLLKAGHSLRK